MSQKKPPFKSVAIYCHHKPAKAAIETIFLRSLTRFLYRRGVKKIHGDTQVVSYLHGTIDPIDHDARYDLKIGVGGDGTILKMIRTLVKNDGLILGVNFGTLGFLSELDPDNFFSSLAKIFRGDYVVDERLLLKGFVYRKNSRGKSEKIFRTYALNEIAFGHGGAARLTNYNVKVDRRAMTMYRADGLIFATPTGTTAYSMSAGGAIVHPEMHSIHVTPVSPHTLTHRPLVMPPDTNFHLDFDSRSESISMTTDGQVYFTMRNTDKVTVQRSTRMARLIRLKSGTYFKTLRNKLGWGE